MPELRNSTDLARAERTRELTGERERGGARLATPVAISSSARDCREPHARTTAVRNRHLLRLVSAYVAPLLPASVWEKELRE
jgi:hypothetical protein